MKQEKQERVQGDDQGKHEGRVTIGDEKGVTWKEVGSTVKDREKWKALWNPLYTGR
jgi:hypothetical protein